MSDGIEFSLTGIDDLVGKINAVKQDVKFKGGRFALRKAATLVAAAAKTSAMKHNDPRTGRAIADNVAVRFSNRKFKNSGDLMFRVGIMQGAQLPELPKGEKAEDGAKAATPHWRLLEFGTEKMRARPFMRPALADNIGEATSEFLQQYEKALDRAIKKATKAST